MVSALLVMAGIGLILGACLAWGSRKFAVEVDPRIGAVDAALPGVNCGACGYPGCAGYAEAIVNEGAAMNLCAPGGGSVAEAIAEAMDASVDAAEAKLAVVACQAGSVADTYRYAGVKDCRAASLMGLAGGRKACTYGCLGFGTCAKACPFDALTMHEGRTPIVDEAKCTGCGRCVDVCPRDINRVDPESRTVYVLCKNQDKGAVANKVCLNACIACRKCMKDCPFDAIQIENNLAVIDYDKCKLCGKCVKSCPKGAIINLRKIRKDRKKAAAGK